MSTRLTDTASRAVALYMAENDLTYKSEAQKVRAIRHFDPGRFQAISCSRLGPLKPLGSVVYILVN